MSIYTNPVSPDYRNYASYYHFLRGHREKQLLEDEVLPPS